MADGWAGIVLGAAAVLMAAVGAGCAPGQSGSPLGTATGFPAAAATATSPAVAPTAPPPTPAATLTAISLEPTAPPLTPAATRTPTSSGSTATPSAIGPSSSPVPSPAPESTSIPDVQLAPAFPDLPSGSFGDRPLFFAEVPDGTRRGVVVEQDGRVFILEIDEATKQSKVFLDLSAKVSRAGNEEGLLGLAFDPGFADNGTSYVYYSAANPRRSVLSRFLVGADPDAVDPASEQVVLEVPQPYSNHNGGMLAFGPDGYLYVSLGDGGSGGDPSGNGQNPATLLGSILRIDVRQPEAGRAYAIPDDNPFVGVPESEARHEVWAYGLRNPWRFTFDRVTGDLWAGDVGQNAWEEVDLVTKGANYGWNVMEGNHCYRSGTCSQSGLVPPVAEYSTGEFGCAVTGGYVYRGERFPELRGVYLYADYCSGLIWGLRYRDGALVAGPKIVADTGRLIPSFGEDADGELYVTAFGGSGGDATVYRIVPTR